MVVLEADSVRGVGIATDQFLTDILSPILRTQLPDCWEEVT